MCYILKERVYTMTYDTSGDTSEVPQEAHAYIIQDLLLRLARLENNDLHPRLKNVEVGLEEIRQEFRIIREEQKAAGEKSDENFRILSQKIDEAIRSVSEKQDHQINAIMSRQDVQIEGILDKIENIFTRLGGIGRTIAYGAGGVTVIAGIITLLVTHGDVIIPALQRVVLG